jgi:hypothetical protein
MKIAGYDQWRLQGPPEDEYPIGQHIGDTCNRIEPTDEDAPRGYRPRPCMGQMVSDYDINRCNYCGEIA